MPQPDTSLPSIPNGWSRAPIDPARRNLKAVGRDPTTPGRDPQGHTPWWWTADTGHHAQTMKTVAAATLATLMLLGISAPVVAGSRSTEMSVSLTIESLPCTVEHPTTALTPTTISCPSQQPWRLDTSQVYDETKDGRAPTFSPFDVDREGASVQRTTVTW